VLVQVTQGGTVADIALEQIPRLAGRGGRERGLKMGRHPTAQHIKFFLAQGGKKIVKATPHLLRDDQVALLVLAQGPVGHGATPGRRLLAELAPAGHVVLEFGLTGTVVRHRLIKPGRRRFGRRLAPPHTH